MSEQGSVATITNGLAVSVAQERWVYRWIISILIGITAGAGSNYITRLDRMTTVEVELRELNKKVDHLVEQQDRKRTL